ncbi:MAG TPA: helix-turn-helix transcriptional regulator [Bacteroidales bacterium]|jgi:transcriptional regulator with XRE-family HTH domain|nr:helix-turn-helix transcriptional regulator [Bacteroidales bacterium]MDD4236505.1 helix-turn-helix transcriptional regulator [Bacteroidales bacterium]HRW22251.1 helix-turn-helix transcriptional regulator [Bacteroidales bacterium]HXK81126.1 helix-turn-helix transcriptional regulator [Bacteroidales bacterium]
MKDRIAKIMEEEGMTATRFAEEIGVQASSISHIVSGRNKPSTDFLIKILERFRGLNAEWLLIGRGNQYKDTNNETENEDVSLKTGLFAEERQAISVKKPISIKDSTVENFVNSDVEKIVIFYKNNTFKTYNPA